MKKKDILIAIIATAFMLLGSIDEKVPTVPEETTETIIQWKQETEVEEVHIEEIEVETVTEPEEEEVKFYNVPLSEELQLHIFAECEKHNIAPTIIIAMIERESDFDASDIGDNGKSFGLMQIQPKWHIERMETLGCTNLLDPFQNVTVGIDYVAWLKAQNADIYWVLMHYNMRWSSADKLWNEGKYSDYAKEVVERASELQKEMEGV